MGTSSNQIPKVALLEYWSHSHYCIADMQNNRSLMRNSIEDAFKVNKRNSGFQISYSKHTLMF